MNQISQTGLVFFIYFACFFTQRKLQFYQNQIVSEKKSLRKIQMSYGDQLNPGTFKKHKHGF